MNNSKKLFTPGPLNTSSYVKEAMNIDIGSRTKTLVNLTRNIRMDLEKIAECGHDFTSVLLQGSGTFAVEAMLTSLVPQDGYVLVISNGIYGERLTRICEIHNIRHKTLRTDPTVSINIEDVKLTFRQAKGITHIAVVQFETAFGVLNDIDSITSLALSHNCEVLVDAMSAFGAIPLNYETLSLSAVASSSNKCLHGAPGISFVLIRKTKLELSNISRVLSLDLKDQWKEFERSGQWRFTPPTHILMALQAAITEFIAGGGRIARLAKYTSLAKQLIEGLHLLDIYPAILDIYRAPMITTFVLGNNYLINSEQLLEALFQQGFVIYASTFNHQKSFRIGCIGEIDISDIEALINAIKRILLKYDQRITYA